MNQVEELNGPTRFVRLKMTNQVPCCGFASQLADFWLCFLHAILAEIRHADFDRRAQDISRMGLAYSDQFDRLACSAAPFGHSLNTRPHANQAPAQIIRSRIVQTHFSCALRAL